MKLIKHILFTTLLCLVFSLARSQEDSATQKTNVQEYTPSKLLHKGQWDIKFFNSIYTQTEKTDAGSNSITIPRETFFTNTTEVYTGVSESARINVGLVFQIRSNTYGGAGALDVLSFKNNGINARSDFTTIAPSIRVQPFENIGNFSFTSSFYIPIFKDTPNAPYLDKRSYTWETKFFYDKTFAADKWQVFTEADLVFNFGESRQDANPLTENEGERFANNSLSLPLSIFLSYFPNSKSTVFVNAQQAFFIGYDNPSNNGENFSQNYTSVGIGGKYQLTSILNLEASFGKFVRGSNFQGLGQTFSLGLRALL